MNYREVLDFWFNELRPRDWFNGGDSVDRAIEERFEPLIESVHQGHCQHWLESPQGRLASIIVLDQFPRNIYRRTPRSFAYDARALELSKEGVSQGVDLKLQPIQRVFFYLPLEHSEKMEDQDLSLERFARVVLNAKPEEAETFRSYLHYAWRHYEIIKRFGRYPHRNDVLGRQATPAEVKFLKQPGSSFL